MEYHGITSYDFLHGNCNIFAEYLHKKYSYNIEAVFEEPSQLIHMYCTTVSPFGEKLYIDVRGVNSDFGEFMQEFEDSGLWTSESMKDGYSYTIKYGKEMPEAHASNGGMNYHHRMSTGNGFSHAWQH